MREVIIIGGTNTFFLLVFACTSLVKLNTVLEASKWYTRELNWQNTRKDIGDLGNRQEAIQISSKSTSFVKYPFFLHALSVGFR